MGRGGQGSATTCCFTWSLPSCCPLLQLYRDCVVRGTRGEEELTFLCRVGGTATSTAAKGASNKQGRPANGRRRERTRRRRKAWAERRRGPAIEGVAAANTATGAASHTGAAVASWSSNHRSSSCQQEQQPSTGEAAFGRSSSPRQKQHQQ